jgi:phosphoribosylformylglycinamidine synthase
MTPRVLILHAPGTNRDAEAARAIELAGGRPEIVHIQRLRERPSMLAEYDLLLIPGGFTYGDALGAGVRLGLDLRVFLWDEIGQYVEEGRHVLGICNGFQALVKAGLLPGEKQGNGLRGASRKVTLTDNADGRFECRWVHLAANPNSNATFLSAVDDLIFCPIAHGEGNFQVSDAETLERLERGGMVAFRYVDEAGAAVEGHYPLNPNGSVADIAGITNERGNVIGLMPHPEDHIVPLQNPVSGDTRLGLALFKALIDHLR